MFWLFYIILLILVIVCCLIGLTTMDQVSEVEYKSLLSKSRFAKAIIFILLLLFTIVAPIYLAVKYYSNLNILPFVYIITASLISFYLMNIFVQEKYKYPDEELVSCSICGERKRYNNCCFCPLCSYAACDEEHYKTHGISYFGVSYRDERSGDFRSENPAGKCPKCRGSLERCAQPNS